MGSATHSLRAHFLVAQCCSRVLCPFWALLGCPASCLPLLLGSWLRGKGGMCCGRLIKVRVNCKLRCKSQGGSEEETPHQLHAGCRAPGRLAEDVSRAGKCGGAYGEVGTSSRALVIASTVKLENRLSRQT